jgi:hypothetical protein
VSKVKFDFVSLRKKTFEHVFSLAFGSCHFGGIILLEMMSSTKTSRGVSNSLIDITKSANDLKNVHCEKREFEKNAF